MADTVTGLHGVVGVLAALRLRDATGRRPARRHGDDRRHGVQRRLPAQRGRRRRRRGPGGPPTGEAGGADDGAEHLRTSPSEIIDAPGGPVIVMGEFKWIWKSINERLGVADPTPPGRHARREGRRPPPGVARLPHVASPPARSCSPRSTGPTWRGASCAPAPRRWRHRRWPTAAPSSRSTTPTAPTPSTRAPYRFSAGESGVRAGAPRQDQHHDEIIADWLG